MKQFTLLIVGGEGGTRVGGSFRRAAEKMELKNSLCNSEEASKGPRWRRVLSWHLMDHKAPDLRGFSQTVVAGCRKNRPDWLLSTGLAPLERGALEEIGRMGVRRLNYLTDDPWNSSHRSRWFFEALLSYDVIFSVRRSNIGDLIKHGCPSVKYLPFGFDPDLFYPAVSGDQEKTERFSFDVAFAGGADRDRVPYLAALIEAGFRVGLYGAYWDRYPETRKHTLGYADPDTLRRVFESSKVTLCLVRRSNRDGNSMRSFEAPAAGACVLAEDTREHREIFGAEGEAACFFRTPKEAAEKTRWLLAHENERLRMAGRSFERITQGRNTYRDRLCEMLGLPLEGT